MRILPLPGEKSSAAASTRGDPGFGEVTGSHRLVHITGMIPFPLDSKILRGLCAALLLPACAQAMVTMDFVPVGNAGNAADTTGYGAVAYEYGIARNETTVSQYAEFLNAVAQSDPHGLYNDAMATNANVAGITRSGSSGSYSYTVTGSGARPITYVSWFDAARFVNWLHNGQGGGDTETGAYLLNGATSGIILAQAGAIFRLPTEDEWYKAAHYDPAKGGSGGYWSYPTQGDILTGNSVGVAGAANYMDGDYAVTQGSLPPGNVLTDAGAYGPDSASYYGTNDQGGGVGEWNDAVISENSRGLRGGTWGRNGTYLNAATRGSLTPASENQFNGFRVVSVPEPGVPAMALLLGGGLLTLRGRLRRSPEP